MDCGGPNCPECAPTCDDRQSNQDEFSPVSLTNPNVVAIDCGGENCPPCSTCDDGIRNAHWVLDLNLTPADLSNDSVGRGPAGFLYRLVMERGIDCGFPCDSVCAPTCTDGILNGNEVGIDCGGPDCPPCPVPPNCFDGIRNGLETGIDCGSLECPVSRRNCPSPNCTDGIRNIHTEITDIVQEGYIIVIEAGIDCDNNPLTSCPDCPLPTCFDGIKNGFETGIDCGGPCITLCSEVPSCHDGVQNGNELGVDCGGDCPPCPYCDDEFKNGPELLIDCLDYPIASYTQSDGSPCPLCPSCHDGILTELLFELNVDCGGPNCKPCDQFLIADGIGANIANMQPFSDQNTLNEALASAGLTDTLFVPDALTLTTQAVPGPGGLPTILYRLRGVQRFAIQGFGTYERVLEIIMPKPSTIQTGLGNGLNLVVFPTAPGAQPVAPTVTYSEGYIDGEFAGTMRFGTIATDVALGDPLNAQLTAGYNYTNIVGGLIQGTINFTRMREINPNPLVTNLEVRVAQTILFSIEYTP